MAKNYNEYKMIYFGSVAKDFESYCNTKKISYSEFVRHSILKNMLDKDTNKKLKERLNAFIKNTEVRWESEILKFHMSNVFFAKNVANKLADAVIACHTRKQLINLIESYKNIAKLKGDRKTLKMLINFKKGLKTQKEFSAIRAEFSDMVRERNNKLMKVRINESKNI